MMPSGLLGTSTTQRRSRGSSTSLRRPATAGLLLLCFRRIAGVMSTAARGPLAPLSRLSCTASALCRVLRRGLAHAVLVVPSVCLVLLPAVLPMLLRQDPGCLQNGKANYKNGVGGGLASQPFRRCRVFLVQTRRLAVGARGRPELSCRPLGYDVPARRSNVVLEATSFADKGLYVRLQKDSTS